MSSALAIRRYGFWPPVWEWGIDNRPCHGQADLPVSGPRVAGTSLQAGRLLFHDPGWSATNRASRSGVALTQQMADLMIDEIAPIGGHLTVPMIDPDSPAVGVEGNNRSVLATDRAVGNEGEAEPVHV